MLIQERSSIGKLSVFPETFCIQVSSFWFSVKPAEFWKSVAVMCVCVAVNLGGGIVT